MKELSVEEAALAWALRKRVEAAQIGTEDWRKMAFIGEYPERYDVFNARVFYRDFKFRLAPEPPAKKWRPWTPEEVPVGALIRHKRVAGVGLILGNGASSELGLAFVDKFQIRREPCGMALDNYEHSIDGGKTWLPCGVEVDA